MVEQVVAAFTKRTDKIKETDKNKIINIAEFFTDTIQGEGINIGHPATFIRVQNCTLNCVWCDTTEVWRQGNPYSIDEIIQLMEKHDIIYKLKSGQHLILTGGSPLLYQNQFVYLINKIKEKYNFKPYIEVENECTIMPTKEFTNIIDCWNNSPKLSNSGMKLELRKKMNVIDYLLEQKNSWFKFVVNNENDWKELQKTYKIPYNKLDRIILMPEGQTREELQKNYETVVTLGIKHNLKICDRFHVTIWNKKVGV
jgi:organic radical activating enzyme